ncbi:GAF domain-containing protein [Pseudonocardia thermophila]|uniref:GAF domain-containing protein n=1 Tax=Pseudonocardia thermophila TaxID=1848 RepID=UPI0009377633|nr:GAF domain-containing protein [Pseudonocardia thermophila]
MDVALRDLLRSMTETLAIASANAATLRALSSDGEWLFPVAAHHPDPRMKTAMTEIMEVTAHRAESGLWRPILDGRAAARFRLATDGDGRAAASAAQRRFLDRYPVSAVLGMALRVDGETVGVASLVEFAAGRDHTDDDEALLAEFVAHAAPVVQLLRAGGLPRWVDRPWS